MVAAGPFGITLHLPPCCLARIYTMFSGQHNDKKDIIREARRKAEAKEPPRTFLGAFILAENIHKHITDLTSLK